jgi:hypothetical protein
MNVLEATTTQCPKCNDRGVVHTEIMAGVWGVGQCDCQPPEHWLERHNRRMAILKQQLIESGIQFGGEKGGEIQHAGR